MTETKYYYPKDVQKLYDNQDNLSDTELYVLKSAMWARAYLANYHGYSDEIPGIEIHNGVFIAHTSKGTIKVPFDYEALHSMHNIEERKVLKVDNGADDLGMDFQGEEPMEDFGDGQEIPADMNEPVDGEEENPFDTNFDAGVEASEEEDPKKFIQQLAGKLSQSLRSYNSELPTPDVDLNKYVAGMVTKQAVEGLSEKDANEILKKIKGDEDANVQNDEPVEDEPQEGQPEQEPTEDEFANESVLRDKINEIFQELTNSNGDEIQMTKPIGKVTTFSKKPFTSPNFQS